MSRFGRVCLCAGVMVGWSAFAVSAEEKVDNPEYKHWAQFKPGSFAEVKMESTVMGTKTKAVTITTLKQLTVEKAVVEVKMTSEAMGQKMEMPPSTQDIPAKIEKQDLPDLEPKKGKQPDGTEVLEVKKGKEEVKIDDKKIATEWLESKVKTGDSTITSKVWTSEEIPGHIVKMTTKVDGQMKSETEGKLERFKADKGGKPDKDKKDARPEADPKGKQAKKAGDEKGEKKDPKEGKDKK